MLLDRFLGFGIELLRRRIELALFEDVARGLAQESNFRMSEDRHLVGGQLARRRLLPLVFVLLLLLLALRALGLGRQAQAEDLVHELLDHGLDDVFVVVALELLDDVLVERLARPNRERAVVVADVDPLQRVLVLGRPPMALQALRRDARARRAAEGQALGLAGVVAVEEGRGVRGEGVDLQKSSGHAVGLPGKLRSRTRWA